MARSVRLTSAIASVYHLRDSGEAPLAIRLRRFAAAAVKPASRHRPPVALSAVPDRAQLVSAGLALSRRWPTAPRTIELCTVRARAYSDRRRSSARETQPRLRRQ